MDQTNKYFINDDCPLCQYLKISLGILKIPHTEHTQNRINDLLLSTHQHNIIFVCPQTLKLCDQQPDLQEFLESQRVILLTEKEQVTLSPITYTPPQNRVFCL